MRLQYGEFENHVSFEGDEAPRHRHNARSQFENHVSFEGDEALDNQHNA